MDYNKKISDLTIGEFEKILENFADRIVYGLYQKQQATAILPAKATPDPNISPYKVRCETKGGIQ